jgi:RNA polymerase sigma-70 factor (ECF subfamily)
VGIVSDYESRDGAQVEPDELVALAQAGNERAWGALYDLLHGPLLNYLRARGARDPEDLLGEVFLRLARNLARFTGGLDGLRAYAFTIAQNCLRDAARRRGVRPDTVFLAPGDVESGYLAQSAVVMSAEEEAMHSVTLERYRDCFADLTAEQRHVLYLRVMADLSIEETAEILSKSPGAIKQMQRRAMDRLRALLSDGSVDAPHSDRERFS